MARRWVVMKKTADQTIGDRDEQEEQKEDDEKIGNVLFTKIKTGQQKEEVEVKKEDQLGLKYEIADPVRI